MVNPRTEKLNIRNGIMKVLSRDKQANKEILISSLKLESGFGRKVIEEIITDLKTIGHIDIIDSVITLTEAGSKFVESQ